MTDIESLYRKENGRILIEISLSSIPQLFNTFDPAPFHEKELDIDAEHYIVDTVNDLPGNTPCAIRIYLPRDLVDSAEGKLIPQAVRNHFAYRALVTERRFRQKVKLGRINLLIALSYLCLTIFVSREILLLGSTLPYILASEVFTISGWVALWTPVTVFLYELWPIIQAKKVYMKIQAMEIEVLPA